MWPKPGRGRQVSDREIKALFVGMLLCRLIAGTLPFLPDLLSKPQKITCLGFTIFFGGMSLALYKQLSTKHD